MLGDSVLLHVFSAITDGTHGVSRVGGFGEAKMTSRPTPPGYVLDRVSLQRQDSTRSVPASPFILTDTWETAEGQLAVIRLPLKRGTLKGHGRLG